MITPEMQPHVHSFLNDSLFLESLSSDDSLQSVIYLNHIVPELEMNTHKILLVLHSSVLISWLTVGKDMDHVAVSCKKIDFSIN